MATAKRHAGKKRRKLRLLAAVLGALAVAAWYYYASLASYSRGAASFAARTACSCHFIGGRDLSQCRDDLEPGMGLVMLSVNEDAKSVTARLLPFSSQKASYRKGWGCLLEPWQG